MFMRDGLVRAVVAKIDTSLVNPALAAVSNVNPASLTNGVTPIISSGNTADNLRADILSIFDSMIAANLDPRSFVLMTTPTVALSISLMVNTLGTPEFPNMTINGGTLQGIPVLVSNYLALAGYGNMERFEGQVAGCCDAGCGVPLRRVGHRDIDQRYDYSESFIPLVHGRLNKTHILGELYARDRRAADPTARPTDYQGLRSAKP